MAAKQKRAAGMLSALALLASSAGLFVSAQAPQPVGTWAPAGAIGDGRTGAAAAALNDGTTIIAGGVTNGSPANTVLLYDPATNALLSAGQLLSARVGHTATVLDDGRVLVIGGRVGDSPSGDIELFDPSSGASTLVGQLSTPRSGHAAARVEDGIVAVFGGVNADGTVLDTVERINVSTGVVSAGPNRMLQARASASATALIDGRVLIAGGNNGSADLRSAELYIAWSQVFEPTHNQLSVPRSGHTALLLPHNGGVLIAGGNSNGAAQSTADLFLPAESPDPFSYGINTFVATGSMGAARLGALGGPVREGYVWVDGGEAGNAETYRFATIKTDKDDYAPGERAVITGSGWLPNAEVRLVFQEDPAVHEDYVLTVTADSAGNIHWDEWAPEQHDMGVRFYLLASDARSRAQTTFTDGSNSLGNISVSAQSPNPVPQGSNATYTITVNRAAPGPGVAGSFDVALSVITALPSGATASFSPTIVTVPSGDNSGTSILTISTSASTPVNLVGTSFTVRGVNQAGGGTNTAQANGLLRVSSGNAAPTVAFATGDTTVDESNVTQHVYTYTISDPNAGDTVGSVTTSCGLNGTKVPSSDTNDNVTGSFACTFPDGPANSTVTVQAFDNHGAASNTATRVVTIANVAPTVTVTGDATANEGQTKTYTYTVTDPGNDPSPTIIESCGANGTRTDTAAPNSFDCTFPDGPASSIVTVTANDGDPSNNIGTGTLTVAIANVAPTVTFNAGPTTVSESGVTEHTYNYTISDPGNDTVSSVNTTCGANGTKVSGSDANNNTSGSFKCKFPDGPATSTVTAQATDSDGDTGANGERLVTVNNVAPTVTLSGPNTADEGQTKHYTFTVSDPGDEIFSLVATCGTNGTKSNENFSTSTGAGSFDCTFPDGPATSTVSAQVSDGDASGTGSIEVTVANVPPTVTLAGATSALEGETKHYTFTVTDPGTETFVLVAATCGTNGNKSNENFNTTTGAGSFDCTFPDGPATSIVRVEVSDETASDDDSKSVDVANVAPTVAFTAGPTTVDESGVTEHTYSYSISDPGVDTITSVSTSCGTGGTKVGGSDANTNTSGSFRCKFLDGPASSTVTVQATDSDGAAGNTAERSVTVNNVAPTVTFTVAPASVSESSATEYTYSYSISDPGDDTVNSVSTSCGANGVKVTGSDTTTTTSGSFRCKFDDGPASSTVTAQATDSDGAAGNIASQPVSIANVAPTATLGNSGPVGEGSAATILFAGQSDPSNADMTAGFRYSFSCVNNAAALAASWGAAGSTSSTSCTFGDNGSYTVLGRIFDKDSGYTDYTTVVMVTNAIPTLNTPVLTLNPFTGAATASINFSDAGWLDIVSSSFDWAGTSKTGTPASYGPGTGPGPLVGTFASSHTFPVGCVSGAISVSVSDDDGGVRSQVLAASGTLDVYSVGFLAPLKDGTRNVVKLGNVIPVKLSIRDCNGAPVTGKTLSIWVAAGIIDYHDVELGAELLPTTSVSSADTNGFMRFVDSHYMYNLATKNLATNLPYTIVIKEGSLVVATAVIEPKK